MNHIELADGQTIDEYMGMLSDLGMFELTENLLNDDNEEEQD